jgi:hypothetical protein
VIGFVDHRDLVAILQIGTDALPINDRRSAHFFQVLRRANARIISNCGVVNAPAATMICFFANTVRSSPLVSSQVLQSALAASRSAR